MDNNSIFHNRIVLEQKIQESFANIKSTIAENKTEDVLKTLSVVVKNTNRDLQNQLTMITSRYNAWKTDSIIGLSPPIEQFNAITKSLVQFVDAIQTEFSKEEGALNTLDNLAASMLKTKSVLSKLKPDLKKAIQTQNPVIGKIWIALLPQLEGTITTICYLLKEVSEIARFIEFERSFKSDSGKLVLELAPPQFSKAIMSKDIDSLNELYKALYPGSKNRYRFSTSNSKEPPAFSAGG